MLLTGGVISPNECAPLCQWLKMFGSELNGVFGRGGLTSLVSASFSAEERTDLDGERGMIEDLDFFPIAKDNNGVLACV